MKVVVSVTSADLPSFIQLVAKKGVDLRELRSKNSLQAEFTVSRQELEVIKSIIDKRGDSFEVINRVGKEIKLSDCLKRWILILVMILLCTLTLWLPERVLFINVKGNSEVSTQRILLAAEECGIRFGADREKIRSVQIKNYLLERLPELGWACVNTNGCVANIYVTERTEQETDREIFENTSGIYAVMDGVIVSEMIHSGFSNVSMGEAVKAGQLLVSGIQKDGVLFRYVRPEAEIYALTSRELHAKYMDEHNKKEYTGERYTNYSLILGKKRINLMKDSRIYTTGCDKIYEEYYVVLPGGYSLPVGLAVETATDYQVRSCDLEECQLDQMADEYMQGYLMTQMISGRIVDRLKASADVPAGNEISVRYQCLEMIGRERSEEIEISYGKDN